MTPKALATLHAAAFAPERGWSAAEFKALLDQAYVFIFAQENGFALTRTLAGESELLTLAVAPGHQGKGIGRALLRNWLSATPAETAFLEVAADNAPALSLYHSVGFKITGTRRAYYTRPGSAAVNAVLMECVLT